MNRIRGVLVVVGLLSSLRDASPINIVRKVTHWLAITFAGEKMHSKSGLRSEYIASDLQCLPATKVSFRF